MTGQTIILRSDRQRRIAHDLIDRAPWDAVCNIREATRTTDQNARMWAMLSDVSRAKPEGRVWTPDVWKAAFMHYLGHEILWQPGLDGQTPFPAGFRSSRLTKDQMGQLMECIAEYGARHGVAWSNETEAA